MGSPFEENRWGELVGLDSAMPIIKETNVKQPRVSSHTYANPVGDNTQKSNANLLKNLNVTEIPTPVNSAMLNEQLLGYDDDLRNYLVKGFSSGFPLGCISTPTASFPKNHGSALNHPDIIQAHIEKSLELGRIAGPFPHPPFNPFVSSPLGVVPKSETG